MAEKTRGFIADEIRVEPKQYPKEPEEGLPGISAEEAVRRLQAIVRGGSPRKNAALIRDAISTGFSWAGTQEGHRFWGDICHRLNRIATDGR